MKIDQFIDELGKYNLPLSEKQLAQFERYFTLLVEWNEKMNLTAITEKEEVYLKHFFDSVTAGFYYDFDREISICDVGAGAGFPSIPLKIMFPKMKVTIVDSLNKRITFLNELAKELELEETYFYHDRAETFGQNKVFREQFDVVTARAVARLSVLSELCLPLVKEGGQFVALKAANADDELKAAQRGIKTLGGEIKEVQSFTLPLEESERNLIIIDKVKKTPKKYPRKPGTPNKSPLE